MEFLMTYGWAILVVMIVIAALYGMGVFSPSVPNSCKLDQPFTCVDVKADKNPVNTITFAISSSGVDGVNNVAVKNGAVSCSAVPDAATVMANLAKSDESQQTISFNNCGVFGKGDVVKGTIEVVWATAGTLGHTSAGSYYAKIE